jgi:hypothetical protein
MRLQQAAILKAAGDEVVDFGAHELVTGDECPKFVVPWCRAARQDAGKTSRGHASEYQPVHRAEMAAGSEASERAGHR